MHLRYYTMVHILCFKWHIGIYNIYLISTRRLLLFSHISLCLVIVFKGLSINIEYRTLFIKHIYYVFIKKVTIL